MVSETARARFDQTIRETVDAGARVLAGAAMLAGEGWFYAPTVLEADSAEPEQALAGAFGPVVLIRSVPSEEAAVEAANSSEFALGASVWGRDRSRAQALARRVVAGMVCVNEAVTPTAHAAAPFGGCKASGFGRTHGTIGLREFAQPQVLYQRSPGGFRPQLFPYSQSGLMERFLTVYRRLFHPGA
jgi:acyl-CoA reductase-like NAD-dependent aldehyde dehydrogenase